MNAYQDLLDYLRETDHLGAALRLLNWDQETGMPEGGQEARAATLSTLAKWIHERSLSPRLLDLLDQARPQAQDPLSKRQIVLVERSLEVAQKTPSRLVEELARVTSIGQQEWAKARKARDFKAFEPHLAEIVRLKREEGACLAPAGGSAYDGLLDQYERGWRESHWDALFADLEAQLPAIFQGALELQARNPPPDHPSLRGPFDDQIQLALCRDLAAGIGYDFEQGRLDISAHPFSETIHAGDSRITTRLDSKDLAYSLWSTLHETGHALYEQGLPTPWAGTPLGQACSMAVHESQSRLWENLVGRSRSYWDTSFSVLCRHAPALAQFGVENWVRLALKVGQGFIRTEADEVSYNLHVLVRYRLEKALLSGDLQVADLPGAWNEGYTRLLGCTPPHDGVGCLQDVHWSAGLFGYFPSYTLGNLLSAQFYDAASAQGATGNVADLLAWLRTHIHQKASALDMAELVEQTVGQPPSALPFLNHLKRRYLANGT